MSEKNIGGIEIQILYMDTVSRRFQYCFIGKLGDWCRAHQVRLIGHVVEENGAHARLGYGSGHYFRSGWNGYGRN